MNPGRTAGWAASVAAHLVLFLNLAAFTWTRHEEPRPRSWNPPPPEIEPVLLVRAPRLSPRTCPPSALDVQVAWSAPPLDPLRNFQPGPASELGDSPAPADLRAQAPFEHRGLVDRIGAGPGLAGRRGTDGRTEETPGATPSPPRQVSDFEAAFLFLARHQAADGSWPAACGPDCAVDPDGARRVGLTGLAVYALMSNHYTHLSRDVIRGRRPGDVVRRGLDFLLSASAASLDDLAIRALALSETEALTATVLVKEPARLARERLVDDLDAGAADAETLTWALLALAEQPEAPAAAGRLLRADPSFEHRVLVRSVLRQKWAVPPDAPDSRCGHDRTDGVLLDPAALHAASWTVLHLGWKGDRLRSRLADTQILDPGRCADGAWSGPRGHLHATSVQLATLGLLNRRKPCVFIMNPQ